MTLFGEGEVIHRKDFIKSFSCLSIEFGLGGHHHRVWVANQGD